MKPLLSPQFASRNDEPIYTNNIVPWANFTITDTHRELKVTRKFVEKKLVKFPRNVQLHLLNKYSKLHESKTAKTPKRSANISLRKSTRLLNQVIAASPFDTASILNNDDKLENIANGLTNQCLEIVNDFADRGSCYESRVTLIANELSQLAQHWQVSLPFNINNIETEKAEGFIVRMCSDKWWLRKVKRARDFTLEHLAIAAGFVRKGFQEYASNQCKQEFKNALEAGRAYLAAMEVVNDETGEAIPLDVIAEKTTANPEKRRIELMVRCKGLEDLAKEAGYSAFMVTWTAPSKYHAQKGEKWNKATPRKTQSYLCAQWAKARSAIKKLNLKWFGVRVTEPHADATPHWHMLVFCDPSHEQKIKFIMKGYALEHDADENGAQKARFIAEDIDESKGSATGYIAKYISKNIDGFGMSDEPDFDGSGSIKDGVIGATAWARRWRIRQFQFFGTAPVSLYRELRRIKEKSEFPELEAVRFQADEGRWKRFTEVLRENPISLKYKEVKNKYGEDEKKIDGVSFISNENVISISTRETAFSIRRKAADLKGGSPSWTRVNNCTEYDEMTINRIKKGAGLDDFAIKQLKRGAKYNGLQIKNGQIIDFEEKARAVTKKTHSIDDKIRRFGRLIKKGNDDNESI